jgi:DNA-binding transcriptional regulator YdaS (Cro superfamily)
MRARGRVYGDDDRRVIALKEAIRRGGGLTAVSHALGVKVQSVHNWEMCPPARCIALSNLTGVSIHTLRPDVFGEEKEARFAG